MNGGKLGSTGCVAYLFERKGVFVVPVDLIEEDRLLELALEAGADDVKVDGDKFEVVSSPENFGPVGEAIRGAGIEPESSQIQRLPTSTVDVDDPETARQVLKLVEALDNHDDVQSVTANFNIPEEAMTQIGAG
jgi:transcriptional/translational regulatory protein YebC/TACO1